MLVTFLMSQTQLHINVETDVRLDKDLQNSGICVIYMQP